MRLRRWWRAPLYGNVCYIPGISRPNRIIGNQWVIRYDSGAMSAFGYSPDEHPGKGGVLQNISLLERRANNTLTLVELASLEQLETEGDFVVFRSNVFSLNTVNSGNPNDFEEIPRGEDLSLVVSNHLLSMNPSLVIDPPVQQDDGTAFWVKDGNEQCRVYVHWVSENRWGMQFARPLGCIAVLLGRGDEKCQCSAIQQIMKRVFADNPDEFYEVKWLSEEETPFAR